ncbi:torsin-1A-like [Mytilus californianus]|uniref:torsin-1A-like n=1 Tax=Mytilus californianus TaxID=6549 RepID=UPI0022457411|nr:torsin-1A-like [Mytilus californianus]
MTVVNNLNAHFMNENPSKALTFSFHGGPGTGKTLITKILVDHLYKEGFKRQFVNMVVATRDFPHKRNTDENNIKIRKLIEDRVKQCERSMNNTGPLLSKQMIDFWHDGKKREEIDLNDLEYVLAKSATISEGSGYYKSDLIFHHLITAYIPFLPIEKEHVFGCIKHHLLAKRYYKHNIDIPIKTIKEIAQQLHFYPNETDKLFSTTGCKRVEEKVDYVMGGTS